MIAPLFWKRALRSKTVWLSLFVILGMGCVAVLAPWLAPHDPLRWDWTRTNLPPAWVANGGNATYPLGTDQFGRDILSRLIYGTRTAFFLALVAVPLAATLGTLAGLLMGYLGGRLDAWLMLLTDIFQSLPGIMLMVIIILIFRTNIAPTWLSGMITLVIGFTAYSWVSLARMVRVNVLLLKSRQFMEAATALGASPRHLIIRHLFPNVLHVILVWMINNIPAVILLEAVLGYIGVGVTGATDGSEFTVVSWGGLFFASRLALNRNPFMLLLPSTCLLLLSMSFIRLADFLNGVTRQE